MRAVVTNELIIPEASWLDYKRTQRMQHLCGADLQVLCFRGRAADLKACATMRAQGSAVAPFRNSLVSSSIEYYPSQIDSETC